MRGMYFFRWYLVEFCVIFSIFVYFFSIFLNGSHVTNKAAKLLLDREAVQVLQEPLKAAKVLEKVVICNILRFSLKNLTIHILCFDFCQQSTFLSSSEVLQIQCRNKVSIFYQQAHTAWRSEYGMTVYLCIWSIQKYPNTSICTYASYVQRLVAFMTHKSNFGCGVFSLKLQLLIRGLSYNISNNKIWN